LRTETTINDTRDFGVGRLLKNMPQLRRIGSAANRRLLEIEQISHDCALGDDAFQHLQRQRRIEGQRAPALRFGDVNAQAVLNAVLMFVFVARGFTDKDLRRQFAVLLGKRADEISPGRMSYELRQLPCSALNAGHDQGSAGGRLRGLASVRNAGGAGFLIHRLHTLARQRAVVGDGLPALAGRGLATAGHHVQRTLGQRRIGRDQREAAVGAAARPRRARRRPIGAAARHAPSRPRHSEPISPIGVWRRAVPLV
jgi:hypothetical protein